MNPRSLHFSFRLILEETKAGWEFTGEGLSEDRFFSPLHTGLEGFVPSHLLVKILMGAFSFSKLLRGGS